MVNWRDSINWVWEGCGSTWSNHAARLLAEKEAAIMASKKRPPLKFNILKPVKFLIGLYYKGQLIRDFIAYDVEEGWFETPHRVIRGSFIVKRLN